MSVLTDQVEAQGVKISDLESSLEEHQHKLNSTEEMLQQVRTSHSAPLPSIQTYELQPCLSLDWLQYDINFLVLYGYQVPFHTVPVHFQTVPVSIQTVF